jgi:predicted phosphodiesterase
MTTSEDISDAEAIAGTASVTALRIGLIADDHCAKEDGGDLPDEVFEAFSGVDLILHLGHMGTRELLARGVLDRLAEVAPVLAVRDYSATADGGSFVTPADGERVSGLTRVIATNGIRIGAVHNLSRRPGPEIACPPGGMPELADLPVAEIVTKKFGAPVDVVAFAGSHRAAAINAAGILFVNPGSPTYPKGPGRKPGVRALGTVGVLDVAGGVATFELIELANLAEA